VNTRARLVPLSRFDDQRGQLIVGEFDAQLPFVPQRFFALAGMTPDTVRGRHAHRRCEQVVVVLRGSCRIELLDAGGRDVVVIDSPSEALYIPAMIWADVLAFAPGSIVLVLASDPYDEGDYVRSLNEFRELIGA
jgi:dTDP-4-dehydrorhamnose 3,5-epimerase-like enzyme